MRKKRDQQTERDNSKGDRLIADLQNDPERFYKNKQSLGLLQEFYHGFPISALCPLLRSDNPIIKRESVWIAAELVNAEDLMDDVLTLLDDDDDYVVFYAAEVVARFYRNIDEFAKVFRLLEHSERSVIDSAMNLIAHFSKAELQWAYDYFCKTDEHSHEQGLWILLHYDEIGEEEMRRFVNSSNTVVSKYGQICAVQP